MERSRRGLSSIEVALIFLGIGLLAFVVYTYAVHRETRTQTERDVVRDSLVHALEQTGMQKTALATKDSILKIRTRSLDSAQEASRHRQANAAASQTKIVQQIKLVVPDSVKSMVDSLVSTSSQQIAEVQIQMHEEHTKLLMTQSQLLDTQKLLAHADSLNAAVTRELKKKTSASFTSRVATAIPVAAITYVVVHLLKI